jgi:hypothetical protein
MILVLFCPECRAEYRPGFSRCCDFRTPFSELGKEESQTELSAKNHKASGRIAAMNMVLFLLTDTGTDFSDKR